jgi:hypothetical protein
MEYQLIPHLEEDAVCAWCHNACGARIEINVYAVLVLTPIGAITLESKVCAPCHTSMVGGEMAMIVRRELDARHARLAQVGKLRDELAGLEIAAYADGFADELVSDPGELASRLSSARDQQAILSEICLLRVSERDIALLQRDEALRQRDAALRERDRALIERDESRLQHKRYKFNTNRELDDRRHYLEVERAENARLIEAHVVVEAERDAAVKALRGLWCCDVVPELRVGADHACDECPYHALPGCASAMRAQVERIVHSPATTGGV